MRRMRRRFRSVLYFRGKDAPDSGIFMEIGGVENGLRTLQKLFRDPSVTLGTLQRHFRDT